MALKTRQPTGAVPWPLVLIEGEEKAGKTWACAEFTKSEQIGRCFWIDLGEGGADEYGAIPGARYEIVEHDGSFAALLANVTEIRDIGAKALADGEKPVVLVIDTMTDEWGLLKDWATDRAKSSKGNRKKLEADPNAEITVSGNYWNDANARHGTLMRILKKFPGIVLMTSHGKSVAVMGPDGQPVEGKKEHKVEAQKSLGADATLWLRLYQSKPGIIVGGRSVRLQFRPGDEPRNLAKAWTLENVIFDVLGCDPATAHVRDFTDRKPDTVTPEQIRDDALRPRSTADQVGELWKEARRLGYDDVTIINEHQAEELLMKFLARIGAEKRAAENGTQSAQSQPEFAWVGDWRKRLAAATTAEEVAALRDEVSHALAAKTIQAGTSSPLFAEARKRHSDVSTDREAEFVTDVLARLGDVTDSAGIEALEAEVRAAAGGVITNGNAADLLQTIADKAAAISQPEAVAA
jgi:hypothetical protein